jgi:hypothetical protein
MAWAPPSKVGDADASIAAAKAILEHVASSYASGVNDGTPFYTAKFGTVLTEFGTRVNTSVAKGTRAGPVIPKPGTLDWATKVQLGILPRVSSPAPPPSVKVTDTHFLSSPGSGADWWVGPSFEVGKFLEGRGVQHWPLGYPKGGYLGLMGGDSAQSYVDTIALEDREHERRIREDVLPRYGIRLAPGEAVTDEHVARLPAAFKLIASGYSQSADGIIKSVARLFGDGGIFAKLRRYLKAILVFGNPARQGGTTRYGRTPKGSGISGYVAPAWLAALIVDVVTESPMAPDFYACCTSKIARMAYEVIIHAETDVPFVVYLAKIAIPAILKLLSGGLLGGSSGGLLGGLGGGLGGLLGGSSGGLLGGLLGGGGVSSAAAIPVLSMASGMSGSALTPLVGMALGGGDEPPQELLDMLSIQGLLTNLPELIALLLALPGIQTHGEYHLPKDEFGGRTGIQVGCDLMLPLI